jgi:hypothetical protein
MSNRTTTRLFWGLAFAGLAVMAAPSGCGGSNTGYGAFANPDGGGGGATYDATNGSSSGNSSNGGSSGGSSSGSQQTCTTSCATDQDCQSSCPPALNGGVNCCDVTSGSCFIPSGTSSCPVAEAGGPSE